MMKRSACFIVFTVLYRTLEITSSELQKRSLIFPPTSPTRAQLIYGIGIPLELETESMTTGYVLKAEYFLPTKSEELRPLMLNPQSINKRDVVGNETMNNQQSKRYSERISELKRDRKNFEDNVKLLSKYRWAVYKGIEMIGDRVGLIGRACMLRSICEAADIPFHYQSGILGELMHIIMTPSSSVDIIARHSDNEYFHAEILGKSGAPCYMIFKECKKSLIEYFSGIFDFSNKFVL